LASFHKTRERLANRATGGLSVVAAHPQ
jgi:hypothetical protein